MPQLLEISGVDVSQGLPVPDGAGSLGLLDVESTYGSLLLTASSVITIAFLIRALPKEKPGIWQVVGYAAMSGAAIGALRGLAGVISSAQAK